MEDRPAPSIFEALWKYRRSSALIVLVILIISGGYGFLTRGNTTATAKMILATPNSDDVVGVSAPTEPTFVRYVAQRALFVTSQQVLRAASQDLGDVSVKELRDNITAAADSDGSAILVTAAAGTAARAAALSNAVVAAYRDQSEQQMLDSANSALDAIHKSEARIVAQVGEQAAARNSTYQNLADQESTLAIATAKFGSGVSFVDPASAASAEEPGLPYVDIAIGLALGLLVAATVAWLRADRAEGQLVAAGGGDDVDGGPAVAAAGPAEVRPHPTAAPEVPPARRDERTEADRTATTKREKKAQRKDAPRKVAKHARAEDGPDTDLTPVASPVAAAPVEPEAVEPEAVEPEAVEPEVVEPEVIEPEPEAVEPDAVEPELEAVEPEPEPVEPEVTEDQPDVDVDVAGPQPALLGTVGTFAGAGRVGPLDLAALPDEQYARAWSEAARSAEAGVVAVAGASPRVGTSTAAAQLAAAAAVTGKRVLVVDAAQGTPRLSKMLRLSGNGAGFSALLAGVSGLPGSTRKVRIGTADLFVVPAGKAVAWPRGRDRARAVADALAAMHAQYDLVFVDLSGALDGPVNAAVLDVSDHVLLVGRDGADDDLVDAAERVTALGGAPVGRLRTFVASGETVDA